MFDNIINKAKSYIGLNKESKVAVTTIKGIDISSWNGSSINWEKVSKTDVKFAIIRSTTKNGNLDTKFWINYRGAKTYNLDVAVYHFSYALDTNKAISEAQHVRRLLTQAGDYTTPQYGIWFDMEGDSYKDPYNVSNETYRAIAHTFVSEMNKYGYDNIGIYANLNWWTTILNDTSLDQYPKWVAQYNSQCDYEKDYIMWQYSSKGAVNGISGYVDMNYYYCYR